MDDTYPAADVRLLGEAFGAIREELGKLGLKLHSSKFKIWPRVDFEQMADLLVVAEDNWRLGGMPAARLVEMRKALGFQPSRESRQLVSVPSAPPAHRLARCLQVRLGPHLLL